MNQAQDDARKARKALDGAHREARATLARVVGDATATLIADSLGGSPANIEGNAVRIASALQAEIAKRLYEDAHRRSEVG